MTFFLDDPLMYILADILNDQIASILVEKRDPCVIDFLYDPLAQCGAEI